MEWIIKILVQAGLFVLLARFLSGVKVESYGNAVIAAIFLSILNALLVPILNVIFIPLTILTLGLFTFVINALAVMIVSHFMNGFKVKDFWWALGFSILLSISNSILAGAFGL